MTQRITVDDILDIIFQRPNRITAGLATRQFEDGDRSWARAKNELRLCPLLGTAQVDQIIDRYEREASSALIKHFDGQFLASATPEDLAFGYDLKNDDRAYLGIMVDAFDFDHPLPIVEHNPAAYAIKERVREVLSPLFPAHEKTHDDMPNAGL